MGMTKKQRKLNGIILIGGLIILVVFYFKDNADMEKVEKKQDKSAEVSGDTSLNALDKIVSDDLDGIGFEQDSLAQVSVDSIMVDDFSTTDSL